MVECEGELISGYIQQMTKREGWAERHGGERSLDPMGEEGVWRSKLGWLE